MPTQKRNIRYILPRAFAMLFWLCAWQALSMSLNQPILLVSPIDTLKTLGRLMMAGTFYQSILLSFGRIIAGFALAAALGIVLAALAARFSLVRIMLDPLMAAIKATPVASFVILALVWINAKNLSIFTSLLMVLPLIYLNVLGGINAAEPKLIQMADVFDIHPAARVRAIYAPAAFPYFLTACKMSLGICWKAGIAAEVIGQPDGSIGDKLYRAKLFLSTDELMAWTLVIILLSVLLEKAVVRLVNKLESVYMGGAADEV